MVIQARLTTAHDQEGICHQIIIHLDITPPQGPYRVTASLGESCSFFSFASLWH